MEDKPLRKIIHVDMDAFYAAVEIRDNPKYRGKPIIVGGPPNTRSVVSTCSYEARKFGIHSAMPCSQAYRLCPQAIFVPGRFQAYREASQQVREIFYQYTDMVEPMSLDEAYLDVTSNKVGEPYASKIAKEIRRKIYETTKLTASAGVSYNKFLAKIGSEMNKPDGLKVITPEEAPKILQELAIGKFHGIGKATELKMKQMGILNGNDLLQWEMKDLISNFGKIGFYYYYIVRGIDDRPVRTRFVRKSLGSETTFSSDIGDIEELLSILKKVALKVESRLAKENLRGKTITLKIKYEDFEQQTRSISIGSSIGDAASLMEITEKLLRQHYDMNRKVRLIGLCVSQFEQRGEWEQSVLDIYKTVEPVGRLY